MKNDNLRKEVLFSSYKALIGNITKNMTLISIRWSADSFHMKVFLNTIPINDDIEIVKEITTEICADLPFITKCKEDVYKWNNHKSELLDETIFLTREHLSQ
jgi:hypothetical protein